MKIPMVWYGTTRTTAVAVASCISQKLRETEMVYQSVAHPENDRTSSHSDMIQVFHWSPSVLAKRTVLMLKKPM